MLPDLFVLFTSGAQLDREGWDYVQPDRYHIKGELSGSGEAQEDYSGSLKSISICLTKTPNYEFERYFVSCTETWSDNLASLYVNRYNCFRVIMLELDTKMPLSVKYLLNWFSSKCWWLSDDFSVLVPCTVSFKQTENRSRIFQGQKAICCLIQNSYICLVNFILIRTQAKPI